MFNIAHFNIRNYLSHITYFNNTLSGEARNVCMRLNLKPIVCIQFVLKMCKLEMKDFEKFSNSSDESTNTRRNFCHYLNVTLNSEFTSFWKDQVLQNGDSGKLKEYKKLKVNVGIEKYLLEIKNFKYRQAVTRLRVSAHRLPVEIGRYKKIAYCDRKCKLCDQGEVGNEQHYLMSCGNTVFTFLRQNFINLVYKINQSFKYFDTQSLFHYILSMKDRNILKLSSKYCYDILRTFDILNELT